MWLGLSRCLHFKLTCTWLRLPLAIKHRHTANPQYRTAPSFPATDSIPVYDHEPPSKITAIPKPPRSSRNPQPNINMAARGPTGNRSGNNRFAQFKLVLLGRWSSLIQYIVPSNLLYRRVCGRKGELGCILSLLSVLILPQSSLVLRFVKVGALKLRM